MLDLFDMNMLSASTALANAHLALLPDKNLATTPRALGGTSADDCTCLQQTHLPVCALGPPESALLPAICGPFWQRASVV